MKEMIPTIWYLLGLICFIVGSIWKIYNYLNK